MKSPARASANAGDDDPYVAFSIQIRRSTYLHLKQAEYWMSGFGEMREHVNRVLAEYVKTLEGSDQPLPEELLAKIKKLNPQPQSKRSKAESTRSEAKESR